VVSLGQKNEFPALMADVCWLAGHPRQTVSNRTPSNGDINFNGAAISPGGIAYAYYVFTPDGDSDGFSCLRFTASPSGSPDRISLRRYGCGLMLLGKGTAN
jgi:hypothetical protein